MHGSSEVEFQLTSSTLLLALQPPCCRAQTHFDGNERLHPLTLPSLPQLSTLPNVIASFSPEPHALPCD